ncbi:MAG: class A beta-lactamase-related serine hydrolase [Chloroflexota bacterium]|nr:class A beta-lactamase-related serine hydrolase [Chloroflexota bacterium]
MATGGWAEVKEIVAGQEPEVAIGVAAQIVGTCCSWSCHGEVVYPAASTIKVAILVALAQALDAGRVSLTDVVAVEPEAVVQGSGVLLEMQPGLSLPIADLAYLMIAVSDNTAANVLIEEVGLTEIQESITGLGLCDLQLNRRFLGRLPGPGEPENYATARDLTMLLTAIAEERAASPEQCAWMLEVLGTQQKRDRLARFLPDGVTFAGKYGSLPGYAHDSGLISNGDETLAIAVLTSGFTDPYAADIVIGDIALAMLDEIS